MGSVPDSWRGSIDENWFHASASNAAKARLIQRRATPRCYTKTGVGPKLAPTRGAEAQRPQCTVYAL